MEKLKTMANIEAEKAVLGCALMNPEKIPAVLLSMLKQEHLYHQVSQKIYQAIKTQFDEGKDCSIIGLSQHNIDPLELMKYGDSACLESRLEEHCETIKNHARHRQLVLLLNSFRETMNEEKDTKKVISDMAESLYSLLDDRDGKKDYYLNRDVILNVFDIVEERHDNKGIRGIPTGFADLDNVVGGWQPGHLIFLMAIPKMGKSAMALEFALNAAERGRKVLYFTLEMSKEEMGERQLSNRFNIDSRKLLTGQLGKDWDKMAHGSGKLAALPIAWVERAGLTITEIKAICRRYQMEYGLDLVIIDQLNKIHLQRKSGENKTDAIERVANGLKVMAQNMKVPVICLHQLLDKVVSSRNIPRPQLGDERDSSAPAQEADIIMYLWRPEFHWPGQYKNQAELIVARQRSSVSNASIWLTWLPKFVALRDMPKEDWPKEVKKR